MRHIIILFTITMLALAGTTHAQPDSLWSRTYGGRSPDRCSSMIQTSDGGYILAGGTGSFGGGEGDMWLVKTDADGDSLWSRTYGGENGEFCNSLIQTVDGGYALAGYTTSFGAGYTDMWLVKTDEDGDSLWSRTYGGRVWDFCNSLIQTTDGGYVLAGYTYSFRDEDYDIWLVKTNANGDSLWSRTYGGRDSDCCNSIIQTADGGYVLSGYTASFGAVGIDMWLVKTNENGDSLWSRTFGGIGWDFCNSLIQTTDGGYVLAGDTWYFSGAENRDMLLVRTNADGDSLWSRTFGGENFDACYSIIQTVDGGFALTGYINFSGAWGPDMWLVRTNADGDSLWSRSFGGEEDDRCLSITQTVDGGYALAGNTDSFGAGGYDMWLVKTGPDPVSVPPESFIPHPSSFILSPAYPNPFNSLTTIRYGLPYPSNVSIQVYNPSGQQIGTLFEGFQHLGIHNTTLTATDLPSGLYFVRLETSGELFTQKIMLVR